MASLRSATPRLRSYFRDKYIPQICEALLCGLLVTCPEDPLKYLEHMILAIIKRGLENLLWDTCIHPSLKSRVRRLSETYLDELFGLDDQLVTPELMIKACTFYTGHLVKTHFSGWKKVAIPRANQEEIMAEKMDKAIAHDNFRCQKYIFNRWFAYTVMSRERLITTLLRLRHLFYMQRQRIILAKWKERARHKSKTREDDLISKHELQLKKWKFKLGKPISLEGSLSDIAVENRRIAFDISVLPEQAILQIFLYLTFKDMMACSRVNRSWMAMIQRGSLWNSIDFSTVKNIADKCVVTTLQKWRLNVLRLNFRGCDFRTKTLKAVSHCKNLQELNVSDCQSFTDESMRHISEGCPGVLYLNLSNTTITNRTMRLLPRYFHNLQNLSLAYCRKFTDKGLQYLNLGNGCHKLIYLDLSGCTQVLVEKCPRISSVVLIGSPHISDSAFKALSSCDLKKIRFEGNKRISDACFKSIDRNYPGINHIYMVDCKGLTDSSLKSLSLLKQLTVLNLTNCIRIGDIGLKHFFDGPASIRLRELNLTNCSLLGDSSVIRLSERCPNLHYLNLRNCEHLTDLAIEYIASMLSLISVDLSGTLISNEGMTILSRHRKLREVSVSDCVNITDFGIRAYCKTSLLLEHLDVSYCSQLTDDIIKTIAIFCTRITSLNIAGCPKITDAGMEILSARCHYLHILDISGCIQLTDQIIQDLQIGCKQLRILKMQFCKSISPAAAQKMSSVVQHQEYNSDNPPHWFGYDSEGNPLDKIHSRVQLRTYSKLIVKEPFSIDEEDPDSKHQ
ncbi:F-box and leucine-rich repeat protein 13 isoform b [Mus musculus]|uniref:F-box and leucine-rich repeat protein 13 n=2 Tax=Mus musculus TaxID=10090 RepID=FXL13_MOUSE|nr:F-box and leucine-rich repeat protein 13 isoform b [Mus musculus]Q8CDU4.2 RecName: Full=F-box and leucine-rich repeat protein 13; AltName: Full=Dynein regulatory complex subunit 6; AltName: Full=F-box/LRR-repeat protein 13 [Mus musculus]|eukprot:NP_796050.2 dynein regulatory complex subunit 6 isoform b [Mus musculus]